ncbi:tRNA (guanine-N(7)-)-methyltransferase subunit WDR4-like [Planoprotostelium fungivorum]|uniref:tRNA (guanine-N(7)-)-methyltransferase non-catalytic subunit n=1 Tax=Planoprotostelium fungivorum TaxID=1890364 RepID=A0A2P6NNM6_9EUKA|nr:tRNA (guanine-N(7)-)-methyltransferase subunit WDR4-like [Planoprotostelium fungivorum]
MVESELLDFIHFSPFQEKQRLQLDDRREYKVSFPFTGIMIEWIMLRTYTQTGGHCPIDFIFREEEGDFAGLDSTELDERWSPERPYGLVEIIVELMHKYTAYHIEKIFDQGVRISSLLQPFIEGREDFELLVTSPTEARISVPLRVKSEELDFFHLKDIKQSLKKTKLERPILDETFKDIRAVLGVKSNGATSIIDIITPHHLNIPSKVFDVTELNEEEFASLTSLLSNVKSRVKKNLRNMKERYTLCTHLCQFLSEECGYRTLEVDFVLYEEVSFVSPDLGKIFIFDLSDLHVTNPVATGVDISRLKKSKKLYKDVPYHVDWNEVRWKREMNKGTTITSEDLHSGIHSDLVRTLSFDEGGKHLVSAGDDKAVKVWSTESWKCIATKKHTKKISTVEFGAHQDGGSRVIYADKFGDVYSSNITDMDSSELMLGHCSTVIYMLLSPRHDFILTADRDEKIRVSHYPNAFDIQSYCLGHTSLVSRLVIPAASQDLLISGGSDGTLRLWKYKTGQLLQTETLDASEKVKANVLSISHSPLDGSIAVVVEGVKSIQIYHLDTERSSLNRAQTIPYGREEKSLAVGAEFAPDGSLYAYGMKPEVVRYQNLEGKYVEASHPIVDAINALVIEAG